MVRGSLPAAVIVVLVCGLGTAPVRAEEERDLSELPTAEIAEILRTERPAPELTEAIRASCGTIRLRCALERAVFNAHGEPLLNAVEHMLALGVFSTGFWAHVSFLTDREAAVEGSLRKIYHPDLHIYTVEMDVRRVHGGAIALTPENTPLRIMATAWGCHRRWILIDWEPGTPVIAFASRGKALFESRRLLVRGWKAYGGHVWKATGREGEILKTLAPLRLTDPAALLEGMRAEDETRRWLSTVRTVMACHGLGEPFTTWWSGGRLSLRLDRAKLEPVRTEVIEALENVRDAIAWNDEQERFERVEVDAAEK